MRPLNEQVIVITGASSGIGRETARLLATRGATVVLAARNDAALADLAAEIQAAGGRALAVPTDVADYAAVEHLGDQAIATFGRIDTWVNNAGVAAYAPLTEMAPDELEQIIRINLLGVMYGTKVAIARMSDGDEGAIVNVSSVLGEAPTPLQAAYVASKHGVKGFTDAVRIELQGRNSQLKLSSVYPASMNTPLFEHARSKLGVLPRPIAPVYDPRVTAEVIVSMAERPRRDAHAGRAGSFFALVSNLAPGALDRYLASGRRGERQQQTDRPDDQRDNLEAPLIEPGSSRGLFGREVSSGNRLVAPLLAAAGAVASVLAIRALTRR